MSTAMSRVIERWKLTVQVCGRADLDVRREGAESSARSARIGDRVGRRLGEAAR